ncbi:MAG: hypothetical protein ACLP8X_35180 [Streptosporangiaceae bacterium]
MTRQPDDSEPSRSIRPANHHRIRDTGDGAGQPFNRLFERRRRRSACRNALGGEAGSQEYLASSAITPIAPVICAWRVGVSLPLLMSRC